VWRLLTFTGAVPNCSACLSFIDTTPPKDRAALGPEYRIKYYEGRCCKHATTQFLYPYAPGGPWAHTMPGRSQGFFLGQHRAGWWHPQGRMAVLFKRFLTNIGLPRHNPAPAVPVVKSQPAGTTAAEGQAADSGNSAPWRLPLAVVAMIVLLTLGALAARPRSSTRPA
jgi:hypothetical protein